MLPNQRKATHYILSFSSPLECVLSCWLACFNPAEKLNVTLTKNFVASDIAYIVNDSVKLEFEDDVDITQALLEEVIKENNPSVSASDLKSYEEMRRTIESNGKEPERRRIGFT